MITEKSPQPISSLDELRLYKEKIYREIQEDEHKIGGLWNDLFHKTTMPEPSTPIQRLTNVMSMGTSIVDGIILGWKLYRKFKGSQVLFKRRRH